MRELALYEEYLIIVRQEKLQQSHATLMSDLSDESARQARTIAHQADLISNLLAALRALNADPGKFIQEYLKHEHQ